MNIAELVRRRAVGRGAGHHSILVRPGLVVDHEVDRLEAEFRARWRAMGIPEAMIEKAILRAREWAIRMAEVTLGPLAGDAELMSRAIKASYREALEGSDRWIRAMMEFLSGFSPESLLVDGMAVDGELDELERRMREKWRREGYPEMAIKAALGWARNYVRKMLLALYPGPENRDLRLRVAKEFYRRALTEMADKWIKRWYEAMFVV